MVLPRKLRRQWRFQTRSGGHDTVGKCLTRWGSVSSEFCIFLPSSHQSHQPTWGRLGNSAKKTSAWLMKMGSYTLPPGCRRIHAHAWSSLVVVRRKKIVNSKKIFPKCAESVFVRFRFDWRLCLLTCEFLYST